MEAMVKWALLWVNVVKKALTLVALLLWRLLLACFTLLASLLVSKRTARTARVPEAMAARGAAVLILDMLVKLIKPAVGEPGLRAVS